MRFQREQWFIGYRKRFLPADPNNVFHRFNVFKPPPDRFWADPFVAVREGEYHVFMEELPYATNKGRIVTCRLGQDGRLSTPEVALECDYHLSYPCVFEWQGEYYMIPETAATRQIELWKATHFPLIWQKECTLMSNVHAVDSTIFEHEGRLWLFSCMATAGSLPYDELFVFHSASPMGPWQPHLLNPVVSDARFGRPGGRPFIWNGRLMRPAQDCTGDYGRSLCVREVTALSPTSFEERTSSTIEPRWHPGLLRTHTLNVEGDLTVIDGCAWRWRRQTGQCAWTSAR